MLLNPMRTRVKICGITRPIDAQAAARAGADAIGLVFYELSPRHVDLARAREICAALPPFVSVVGLFVNPRPGQVTALLEALPIDVLQFHGDESAPACEGFARPYIKAVAMREGIEPQQIMAEHPCAAGFLFDAYQGEARGGGGEAFDWSKMPREAQRPLILAGGLNPDNVGEAIVATRPYALDVSSGVELAKGIKSRELIEAFMRGVQRGDAKRAGC
jgi:phosphoribosylanthranilate isomerase